MKGIKVLTVCLYIEEVLRYATVVIRECSVSTVLYTMFSTTRLSVGNWEILRTLLLHLMPIFEEKDHQTDEYTGIS